ncbi:MAG: MFS transporter [Deltaproteobacteria bacterium]|nr:MFS transporter [Deltaproteobacteria bacterium]MBN2687690.1 MFS transporter [Deltaproteobacteria bacterium]
MASALADIVGMRTWGLLADRIKNKGVVQIAGWIAIFLPLAWVTVRPDNTVFAFFLHVVGGGFWAGITLCMNNLLLKISPRQDRTFFFSIHNITAGLGAALGPILAGYLIEHMSRTSVHLFSWNVAPIQTIFIISTVLRLLSFQLFRHIDEPEAVPVGQIIRVLRSIRGLNMASGFNYILHPFIEISRSDEKDTPDGP